MSSEKEKISYNVYPETKDFIKNLAIVLNKKEGANLDEIITDYSKYKVLSDDYYYYRDDYDKEYYCFSRIDLKNNGETKGYNNINSIKSNKKDIIIVNYVPNTFDEFNKDFKTYCYNNKPYLHKGVITTNMVYDKLVLLVITTDFEKKEMNIELYENLDDLYLIEDLGTHEKREEITERLKAQYEYYNSGLGKADTKIKDSYHRDNTCLEEYKFMRKLLYKSRIIEDLLKEEDDK